MYRPSLLSCVLHHPIVYIKTYLKVFLTLTVLLAMVGRAGMTSGQAKLFLIVIGLIALCMMRGAVAKMEEKRNAPPKRSLAMVGRAGMTSGQAKLFLIVIGLIALCMMRGAVAKMEEKRNAPPKRSLFGTAVCSMVGSAIRSSNRRSDAFQKGMSDAI